MSYDLAGQQGTAEPEQEQPEEDEDHGTGFARFLGDVFGQQSTFQVRPAPLQGAQFSGASPGSSGAPREMATPPGLSAAAETQNQASRDASASLAGRSRSTNGTSQQHIARIWGQG
jgi:hypothetical protein